MKKTGKLSLYGVVALLFGSLFLLLGSQLHIYNQPLYTLLWIGIVVISEILALILFGVAIALKGSFWNVVGVVISLIIALIFSIYLFASVNAFLCRTQGIDNGPCHSYEQFVPSL